MMEGMEWLAVVGVVVTQEMDLAGVLGIPAHQVVITPVLLLI